jgi:hypothetical protein
VKPNLIKWRLEGLRAWRGTAAFGLVRMQALGFVPVALSPIPLWSSCHHVSRYIRVAGFTEVRHRARKIGV